MTAILGGALIISVVFAGLFIATAKALGWKVATVIWAASIAITAVMTAGAFLIASGVESR